jgi:hypothetical protein
MYGEVDVFLAWALVRVEWSASLPSHFTPGESTPGTHWIAGWVGPQSWSAYGEVKNSWPCQNSNSNLSVVQPVAGRYTDCATG